MDPIKHFITNHKTDGWDVCDGMENVAWMDGIDGNVYRWSGCNDGIHGCTEHARMHRLTDHGSMDPWIYGIDWIATTYGCIAEFLLIGLTDCNPYADLIWHSN